jgi:hypothetical protein
MPNAFKDRGCVTFKAGQTLFQRILTVSVDLYTIEIPACTDILGMRRKYTLFA